MDKKESQRIQEYLQDKFQSKVIRVVERPKKDDSMEVFIEDEFIGVIFRDDEDGEVSYSFNMAILDIDL
ncbi:MAG: DUF3126 family protein [Hyphomicrobiales bacterium]|jgi:hypothetical protein|nr:DUF3126 family protein [Hyphomicrobiales bacterium]|tara:strand:+ start:455 stop:661 length:207 start_codon:yes stop_codon:yes gene_type:complete